MFQYKCTIFRENYISALTCVNWHLVLPEVGTLALEHGGDAPLIFSIINLLIN